MKIAVITGASSGMGRETVLQLSDHFPGFDEMWVIARREERLKELAAQCPVRLLESALRACSPDVKYLVNAAGFGKIGPVGSIASGDETGMVRVNCEALVAVTHLVLPYMTHNSRILMFASAASFLPQPDFAVYAATKAFVLSYSRALNEELKDRDIAVTAVCPGPVRTEFFDKQNVLNQMFYSLSRTTDHNSRSGLIPCFF